MPCYHPLEAARPTGSDLKPLIYSKGQRPDPLAKGWERLSIPCGKCIGCRLEVSRTWAARIMHEAQLHQDNCFVTFTYDEDHCPADYSLVPDHFTLFLKRLRRWHEPNRLRFFHCGEYGDNFERPHYHACLFGIAFADKQLWTRQRDHELFTSETLDKIWTHGRCLIGQLTFESAAYVARYVCKKVNGARKDEHYTRMDPRTGLVHQVEPEYATQSRRPGLGKQWFDEFKTDVFPWDEIIVRGHPCKPPRYYDKLLEESDPGLLQAIKLQRELAALTRAHDNTPERLYQREKVKEAQFTMLKRGYENEPTSI